MGAPQALCNFRLTPDDLHFRSLTGQFHHANPQTSPSRKFLRVSGNYPPRASPEESESPKPPCLSRFAGTTDRYSAPTLPHVHRHTPRFLTPSGIISTIPTRQSSKFSTASSPASRIPIPRCPQPFYRHAKTSGPPENDKSRSPEDPRPSWKF